MTDDIKEKDFFSTQKDSFHVQKYEIILIKWRIGNLMKGTYLSWYKSDVLFNEVKRSPRQDNIVLTPSVAPEDDTCSWGQTGFLRMNPAPVICYKVLTRILGLKQVSGVKSGFKGWNKFLWINPASGIDLNYWTRA